MGRHKNFDICGESTIKDVCMRTASPLILVPAKLRTSEGTGAHHREGDAIRAAEAALMLSSRRFYGGFSCHTCLPGIILSSDGDRVK